MWLFWGRICLDLSRGDALVGSKGQVWWQYVVVAALLPISSLRGHMGRQLRTFGPTSRQGLGTTPRQGGRSAVRALQGVGCWASGEVQQRCGGPGKV